ncbi:hypothetical protein [Microbacterium sp. Se63.02b]|uniref:hypothetical protein n=1 Tax=Microbacterium sp. Se63.02b TaxID=2709304 RepID=UPI001FCEAE06|nr:hypothetical protein [Microbacterium sp. Se63.02b]
MTANTGTGSSAPIAAVTSGVVDPDHDPSSTIGGSSAGSPAESGIDQSPVARSSSPVVEASETSAPTRPVSRCTKMSAVSRMVSSAAPIPAARSCRSWWAVLIA